MKLLALSIDRINQNDAPIQINPPGGIPSGGFTGGTDSLGNHILQWFFIVFFVIATILALFYFIYGGIQWITSGGDKTKVQAARNRMMYSIIGLIIVSLAFFIITFIGSLFGVSLFMVPPKLPTCTEASASVIQNQQVCSCKAPLHEVDASASPGDKLCIR